MLAILGADFVYAQAQKSGNSLLRMRYDWSILAHMPNTPATPTIPCPACEGEGRIEYPLPARHSAQIDQEFGASPCEACDGTGRIEPDCLDCGNPLRAVTTPIGTLLWVCDECSPPREPSDPSGDPAGSGDINTSPSYRSAMIDAGRGRLLR